MPVRAVQRNSLPRRLIAAALAVCIASVQITSAVATAQTDGPDFESPVIEHEQSDGGLAGGVELFNATVVDNDELSSVRLFYRFSGDTEYTRINMRQITSSSNYTARVITSSIDESDNVNGIEYYIRAEDVAGNLVLKGFAFQPLLRKFETAKISEQPVETAQTVDSSSRINWLWVALGALVVGGVAAASSGSSSSNECVDSCTVSVTFDPP
jgi:hypothetical protein